jgi:bifunctional DNA-binding transcriptional regulator/antitoxin component of YhaV-PrlF toxin-antitoxin module
LEAITHTHQVTIPKPTHAGIDPNMGDVVEITKSWGTHIPKNVSRDAKGAYVAVLKSAVGSLKIDKNRLKKLQESIGESMRV